MADLGSLLWVLQTNLGSSAELERLSSAINALRIQQRAVVATPFSDSVPEVIWDGPVIAYGATRFITNVVRENRWRPGAFFHEDHFSMDAVIGHLGTNVLNCSAQFTTIEGFKKFDYPKDLSVFVRPRRDLKEFEAIIESVGTLQDWFQGICEGDFELKPDTPILVAHPVEISAEWRVFIVGSKYSSGSQYRSFGDLHLDAYVPKDVSKFAVSMAERWSPAEVFVLDVGLGPVDNYRAAIMAATRFQFAA